MASRIGIVGAGGRMGRMLIEATLKDGEVQLGAAIDVPGSPAVGRTAAACAAHNARTSAIRIRAAFIVRAPCLSIVRQPAGRSRSDDKGCNGSRRAHSRSIR